MKTSFDGGPVEVGEMNILNSLESMSIIDLNRLSMHYLSREAFSECFHLLKQAETVIE